MGLFQELKEIVVNARGPLTRQDRPRWAAARSVADLAELTAQWLEGRIDSQPGYYGTVDVDEDLAPGLTRTLVACNRGGFLTNDSQAGQLWPDGDWQLAAVTGFAMRPVCDTIRLGLRGSPFQVLTQPFWGHDHGVVVTTCYGRPLTTYGSRPLRMDLHTMYDGCSKDALRAVQQTMQLTVYDPRPGRNTLWSVLQQVAPGLEAGAVDVEATDGE